MTRPRLYLPIKLARDIDRTARDFTFGGYVGRERSRPLYPPRLDALYPPPRARVRVVMEFGALRIARTRGGRVLV